MVSKRLCLALCLLFASTAFAPPATAAPWEEAVETARAAQDREIQQAKRNKNLARVVNVAKARLARQRNVLNTYLVGRALYYDAKYDQSLAGQLAREGKKAEAEKLALRARGKAQESIQVMRECVRIEPRFWYAHKSLAQLYLETNQLDPALVHLNNVLGVKASDADVLKLAVAIHGARKEWPQVERYANSFLQRYPQELAMRMALVQCLADQGRLKDAEREMEVVIRQKGDDPQLRMSYVLLLYRIAFQGKAEGGEPDAAPLRKAANQLERIIRTRPNSFELWGTLGEMYFHLKDKKNLERVLVQMVRYAPSADTKQRLEKNLEALRKGGRIGGPPASGGPRPVAKDPVAQLVEAALDETNAKKRQDALQQYLDARIPFLPLVLYARVDPQLEPNPGCRRLILRILGQMEALEAIKHIARGLWDPDPSVRVVASDELGKYTHKGILLYLEPTLFNVRIDPIPNAEKARRALGLEYNSVRDALFNHTKFRDRELMAEGPIPLEKAAANRERWQTFFRSDRGRLAFLDALDKFGELGDPYPERYLLVRAAGEDEHLEVRRRAYAVLRAHAEQVEAGDQDFLKKRWAGFPIFDPQSISKETSAETRRRLLAWYQTTRTGNAAPK
ncbi:MAG: tetratricopeptide repeat protein [Planctomycetota bacterium]|nr:tetratricopeptide repeat protein [Planctomycetota bacterium]